MVSWLQNLSPPLVKHAGADLVLCPEGVCSWDLGRTPAILTDGFRRFPLKLAKARRSTLGLRASERWDNKLVIWFLSGLYHNIEINSKL